MIGLCVLVLMALQPITELLNHYFHERYPRIIYLGHVHVWLGRILITVGIVNGGLGFRFADTIPCPRWPQWPKIVYGAVATSIWIVYVAIIIVWDKFNQSEAQAEIGDEEVGPGLTTIVPSRAAEGDSDICLDAKPEQDNAEFAQGNAKDTEQQDRQRTSEEATVIFTTRSMKI